MHHYLIKFNKINVVQFWLTPMTMNTTQPKLPSHVQVIANEDVWMEGRAYEQIAQVAHRSGCCRAVGMPDLHPGRGIPIGAVFAFRDVIHPALVGGDAGCGVRVFAIKKAKLRGDALERRIREATAGPALPDVSANHLFSAVWQHGVQGLANVDGIPNSLAVLAEAAPPTDGPIGPIPEEITQKIAARQLGTIGGGNHFLELAQVTAVADRAIARSLGLTSGTQVVVAHSGSRGLGGTIAQIWGPRILETNEDCQAYLADLAGACRYARTNRFILAWRMLNALSATRASRLAGTFDVHHNTVIQAMVNGHPAWVHRKGAAPADDGEPTIVLGSRGTPSWIMRGAGCEATLNSVAHGAGRRMGRTEAVGKLRTKYTRKSLLRTVAGGRVICDDERLLFAEHPDAYKDIEPVVASLEDVGAATRVAALTPLVTVKRSQDD